MLGPKETCEQLALIAGQSLGYLEEVGISNPAAQCSELVNDILDRCHDEQGNLVVAALAVAFIDVIDYGRGLVAADQLIDEVEKGVDDGNFRRT